MVPAIDQPRDVTPAKNKSHTNRPSAGAQRVGLAPTSACQTPPLGHISIPLVSIVLIGGHKSWSVMARHVGMMRLEVFGLTGMR